MWGCFIVEYYIIAFVSVPELLSWPYSMPLSTSALITSLKVSSDVGSP